MSPSQAQQNKSSTPQSYEISPEDYEVALRAARQELCRLHVFSIGGMEAHDFAVEAVMASMRWGGSKWVARRAKLIVLDKLRTETGIRRVPSSRGQHIQCDYLDSYSKKEIDHSNKDLEELLDSSSLPTRLKDIVRMKINLGLKDKQVAERLGIRASSLSQYLSEWSEHVKDFVDHRTRPFGIALTRNLKKRTARSKIHTINRQESLKNS